jgi:hypothetical protein
MEQTLLGHARTFHPGDVRGIGTHLLSVLNPDGVLTEEKDQQRRRNLGLVPSGLRIPVLPQTTGVDREASRPTLGEGRQDRRR